MIYFYENTNIYIYNYNCKLQSHSPTTIEVIQLYDFRTVIIAQMHLQLDFKLKTTSIQMHNCLIIKYIYIVLMIYICIIQFHIHY